MRRPEGEHRNSLNCGYINLALAQVPLVVGEQGLIAVRGMPRPQALSLWDACRLSVEQVHWKGWQSVPAPLLRSSAAQLPGLQ
jgi:hypothetical protein